jgi:Ca2+-binding RTX toxin-like protein
MTNDQNGVALPGDSYERMRTLLDLQPMGGTYPNDVTIRAADVTHPMMQDYAPSELIRSYTGAGWLAYAPVNTAGTDVLATQTVNGRTYDAVIATNTGGDNIHFSTDAVMADNNLLWQAIDYAVNGSGVSVGLQLSRQTSILASRTDMDQAMETMDVSPASGPGIYDKLLPILAQWKAQYNFVGSYFIDVGNNPPEETTSWPKSGTYYKQILAMGNELGSHSVTHPENTNTLSASQIQSEFQGSRQIIEQQMSQILGHPFTVDGAAVPGMPESLSTALSIIQYYDYISGGFSSVGAGYPGAIGYLTPAMASLNKPYIAPNVEFDFSLVEFKGMTAAQAAAEWSKEWTSLNSHAEVPIIVWPWHDYGAAVWSTNQPAPSPYTTSMYTDFIARAYNAGAEFVTLDDLAQRIESLHNSAITTTVSGSTITATVTSPDAGKFALHLDNLGTQKIGHVTGWYAYDNDSILLPRGGGTYTIHLGTAADDVTHLTTLPMRSELLTLTGDGNNLGFSVVGEGDVVIDLKNPAGESMIVTGATYKTLSGDILTLGLGAIAQHDVSVALSFSHAITGDGLANTLIGTSGDDTLSGLGGNDTLIAGAGNDRLDGGAGADAMTGGTGNDTYVVDNASDVVTENPNEGTDTVQSSITYTLPANVENLTLTGNASINGAGNALNNVITGNSGNNVLNGGAGSDTLIGGAGNDTFIYDAADASIQGGAGLDTLKIAGSGVTLDLTLIPDTRITDVEVIDIAGTGNNTVALKLSDVLAMSSTTDTLRIDGNAGDRVTAVDAGSWVHGADQVISANTYHAFSQASALLLVDSHVVTNIV